MRGAFIKLSPLALAATPLAASPAQAFCVFGAVTRPKRTRKQIFENSVQATLRQAVQDRRIQADDGRAPGMHATGEKGYEIFFNAPVQFPEGANLECKPTTPENFPKAARPANIM